MINGIRLKVCGLTNLVDADLAGGCGADFLGFVLYPKSPRYIPLESFKSMSHRLPPRKKVAVCVSPSVEELGRYAEAGFDYFQIHFPIDAPVEMIEAWSKKIGADRLWLAPKLPPDAGLDRVWLKWCHAILWDAYKPEGFGGSGETSDWAKFTRCQESHPSKTWILAGGLNPENIAAAIKGTGARFVDVNSGVEMTPGVKSEKKLRRFVLALHEATKHGNPAY